MRWVGFIPAATAALSGLVWAVLEVLDRLWPTPGCPSGLAGGVVIAGAVITFLLPGWVAGRRGGGSAVRWSPLGGALSFGIITLATVLFHTSVGVRVTHGRMMINAPTESFSVRVQDLAIGVLLFVFLAWVAACWGAAMKRRWESA